MTKKSCNYLKSILKNKLFFKNRKFHYIIFSALVIMIGFILTFQNCKVSDETNLYKDIVIDSPDFISSAPSSPTMPSSWDKAVFNISEKQGNMISNILWQVKNQPCHGESEVIATGTDLSLEIDQESVIGISVEVFVQFEEQECITYKKHELQDPNVVCTTSYTFEDFKRDHNPWKVLATLSSDETVVGNDFSIGSVVDVEFIGEDHEWEGELNPLNFLDFDFFQWSIKKAGEQTELADQANTTEGLIHTFSQVGVYNIFVSADLADGNVETEQFSEEQLHEQELYDEIKADGGISRNSRLIIGKCEEEDAVDIEVSFE